MPGDNFVERVHAYSKWLLRLEEPDSDSATTLRSLDANFHFRTEDHGHS